MSLSSTDRLVVMARPAATTAATAIEIITQEAAALPTSTATATAVTETAQTAAAIGHRRIDDVDDESLVATRPSLDGTGANGDLVHQASNLQVCRVLFFSLDL